MTASGHRHATCPECGRDVGLVSLAMPGSFAEPKLARHAITPDTSNGGRGSYVRRPICVGSGLVVPASEIRPGLGDRRPPIRRQPTTQGQTGHHAGHRA